MAFQIIHQNGFVKIIDTITSRDYFFNLSQVKLKRDYVINHFKITDGYEVVDVGVFSDCTDADGVAFASESALLNIELTALLLAFYWIGIIIYNKR